jgi:hypothetical protein
MKAKHQQRRDKTVGKYIRARTARLIRPANEFINCPDARMAALYVLDWDILSPPRRVALSPTKAPFTIFCHACTNTAEDHPTSDSNKQLPMFNRLDLFIEFV